MPPFTRLIVPAPLHDAMLRHALDERPLECCGLLAGTITDGVGRVVERYPLVNKAASPVNYEPESRGEIAAHRDMWGRRLDVLAVYHSHPLSPPVPSPTDLALNGYGEYAVHLIVSLKGEAPSVRGWWLTETDYREAEWAVEPEGAG
jgi:proteasome lid subunit RPN8/RPN11